MRLSSINIKNFRIFKDQTVNFDGYTSFVGANGAGKSTVLDALNVFFREQSAGRDGSKPLTKEDFHRKDTTEPIEITLTFEQLSDEAKEDFKNYFRNDKLIVTASAEFNETTELAEVKQRGNRTGIQDFAGLFASLESTAAATALKNDYNTLRKDFPDLPDWKNKKQAREALLNYEMENVHKCTTIPSNDQFYGISRGANLLQKYVQWVFVPAVKDANEESIESRNSALGKILSRTIGAKVDFSESIDQVRLDARKSYQEVLAEKQSSLTAVSESISSKLRTWSHPSAKAHVVWAEEPEKSVKVAEPYAQVFAEDEAFKGAISKFGHGMQRSLLLALLQELAEAGSSDAPTLILGCEEPELYQHPPQSIHLSEVFSRLADDGSQVLVTTHSPYFVKAPDFDGLRLVRFDGSSGAAVVGALSIDDFEKELLKISNKPNKLSDSATQIRLAKVLEGALREMFFASKIVFVEGREDSIILGSALTLLGFDEEFRANGGHIISVGGKNQLAKPIIIAQQMGIPHFVVFDGDVSEQNREQESGKKAIKDNKELLGLLHGSDHDSASVVDVWGTNFVMWGKNIGSMINREVGDEEWEKYLQASREQLGFPGDLKDKDPALVSIALLKLQESGSDLPTPLKNLCEKLAAGNWTS